MKCYRILDFVQAGFANDGLLTIAALFIVVDGFGRARVVEKLSRKVFGKKSSLTMFLLRMMTVASLASVFFNNVPLVALLFPITRDFARVRGFARMKMLIYFALHYRIVPIT